MAEDDERKAAGRAGVQPGQEHRLGDHHDQEREDGPLPGRVGDQFGKVPESPDHADQQRRPEVAQLPLQAGKRIAAPADLFEESHQEDRRDEGGGDLRPVEGHVQGGDGSAQRDGRRRGQPGDQQRHQQRRRIAVPGEPPPPQLAQQSTQAAEPAAEDGSDEGGEQRTEGDHRAAVRIEHHQRPGQPGQQEGQDEVDRESVPGRPGRPEGHSVLGAQGRAERWVAGAGPPSYTGQTRLGAHDRDLVVVAAGEG